MTENPLGNFDKEVRACRKLLAKGYGDDALMSLFVRMLLVGAYGAYEKAMRDAVEQRAEKSGDGEFVRYLGRATQRYGAPFDGILVYRLRVLEGAYSKWSMQIQNEAVRAYRKLAKHRHKVAHGEDTDMGWEEALRIHDMAKTVPLTFVDALCKMSGHMRAGRPPTR